MTTIDPDEDESIDQVLQITVRSKGIQVVVMPNKHSLRKSCSINRPVTRVTGRMKRETNCM